MELIEHFVNREHYMAVDHELTVLLRSHAFLNEYGLQSNLK